MAATRLGAILCEEGMISDLQLAEALQVQKEEQSRIGDILVDLGYLTKRQLRYVIREHKRRIPLGEYLLEKGIITAEELESALGKKDGTRQQLGQTLIDSSIITEEQLAEALSEQLDMPYIVPYQRLVDRRVFTRLPADFMRHNKVLPLAEREGVTTVLVPGLLDEATSQLLENVFGQDIELAICPPSRIQELIDSLLEQTTVPGLAEEGAEDEMLAADEVGRMDMAGERFRRGAVETQAVDVVNYLINEAINEEASDVHLESMNNRVQVRFRTNGIITRKMDLPLNIRDAVFRRIKVLSGLNVSETHKEQEGRLMGRLEDVKVDMRVSILVGMLGEALVLRLFRQDTDMIAIEDVGMTPNVYAMCRRALDYASGMIIFAGPPASGKTTSLYAALNHLNRPGTKIVTVEEPVEAILPGTIQAQLSSYRGSTLADVINAAIHQDPDVIAVGEIPYSTQARDVLWSALMGHKMLTTFHADDTVGSLLRLTDLGIKTFLRSSTALTIVCQRLVRRICPHCRAVFQPDQQALREFPIRDFDPSKYDFYHGKGCKECQNTGFAGRTGVFEALTVNDDLREAFLAGAPASEVLKVARSTMPFLTINEIGALKVIRGITTADEILRVAPLVSRDREMKNPLSMPEIERISEASLFGE